MINPDMCSCCGEIWNRENLDNIPLGKHTLHLCPDCYKEYITSCQLSIKDIQQEIIQDKHDKYLKENNR